MIENAINLVQRGTDLSMEQMSDAIAAMMSGRCDEDEIGRFLLALRNKGEVTTEVAGAAAAMRGRMTRIRSSRSGLLDTCGTGGDGSSTFNISTAAALVAAAAGVPVAKHGNRGITSRSGSADVLVALGVDIEADVPRVEACLDELGICFCFAPLMHQAMKHVAGVRKKLGVPTIFNMLGPLVNPASAPYQLLGVGRDALRPLLSEALAMLGARRVLVVHGSDGLDEVTLGGPTEVTEATEGTTRQFQWTPEDFGLEEVDMKSLSVEGPEQSAAVIRDLFAGKIGPARDIVVANAAAALWTAGRDDALAECTRLATEVIDSGAVAELLARLVEQTNT